MVLILILFDAWVFGNFAGSRVGFVVILVVLGVSLVFGSLIGRF